MEHSRKGSRLVRLGKSLGVLLAALIQVSILNGQAGWTYYVSPGGNNTTGTGTKANPWKTLTYARTHLLAGETLMVRGGIYREYLTFLHSGSATAPVTVRGYPGEEAIVTAMVSSGTNDWELVSGEIYRYKSLKENYTYENASQDGIPLRLMQPSNGQEGTASMITGDGQWARFRSTTAPDELWVRAKGGGNPGAKNVEVSEIYETIIVERGIDHVVIENLTIEGGYYPLRVSGSHFTVRNCIIRNCFGDAIKVPASTTPVTDDWSSEHGLVENCDIYHFGESGIDITGGDYWTIRRTSIHHGVANRWNTPPSTVDTLVNGIMIKNNSVGVVVDGCRISDLPKAVFGALMIGGDTYHTDPARPSADQVVVKNTIIERVTSNYIVGFFGAQGCLFVNNAIIDCTGQNLGPSASSLSLYHMREGPSKTDATITYPSANNTIANTLTFNNSVALNYDEPAAGNRTGLVISRNFSDALLNSRFDGTLMTHPSIVAYLGYDTDSFNYVSPASAAWPAFADWSKRLIRLAQGGNGEDDGNAYLGAGGPTMDFTGIQRALGQAFDIGPFENGLYTSRTVYSDGTNTTGWVIAGTASATSVWDSHRLSQVVEFNGTGSSWLFNAAGTSWNNNKQFVCTWKAKSTAQHSMSVRLKTKSGLFKQLKYYSSYTSTNFTDSATLRFPLGSGPASTQDGTWHSYARHLQADLRTALPAEEIDFIDRFYVEGSAAAVLRLDDVELHNSLQSGLTPDTCLGEWVFAEMQGAYTEDRSAQGRHGILHNMPLSNPRTSSWKLTAGSRGLRYQDSEHQYVEIPALAGTPFTRGFSAHTRVRFENLTDTDRSILSGLTGDGVYGRLTQQADAVRFEIRMDGGSILSAQTSSALWNVGDWVDLTVVTNLSDKTIRIFVNGLEATVGGAASFTQSTIDSGTDPLRIGSGTNAGQTFNGVIDSARVYGVALTAEEIAFLGSQ